MKKLLVVSAIAALGLNSVALAGGLPEEMPMAPAAVATSDAGIYLGIEGGYGMTHWKNLESADSVFSISNDNGIVGRAFLGYDINRYFALEFGYSYFFNKAKINVLNVEVASVKTQAFDLMGKIKAPVVENFDLYAKLGVNYLMSHGSSNFSGFGNDKNTNNFNVAYGAGADYYITPNVIVNIEWLRFNGNAKLGNKYQPNTDAFMIGLRYKFDL
jgi:opacity protein-like surface antigen